MITDKRKAVLENFSEEFSINKAIEVLEGLGYQVKKEFTFEDAKDIIEENSQIVMSVKELEEHLSDAYDEFLEDFKDEHLVIANSKVEEVEKAFKDEIVGDKILLTEDEGNRIISQVERQTKQELRDEILEECKDEILEDHKDEILEDFTRGKIILDENEVEEVDAELKKIIAEKVKAKLEKLGISEDDLDDDLDDDDDDDDILDDDDDKKSESVKNKKRPRLYETLIGGNKLEKVSKEAKGEALYKKLV